MIETPEKQAIISGIGISRIGRRTGIPGLDLTIENKVILEIKCLEHILPVHEAQLLTYLKMTGIRVGLILNFNVSTLIRGGVVRKVL